MKRRAFLAISAAAIPAQILPVELVPHRTTVGVIGHTGQGNYGHGEDIAWLKIPETQIIALADAEPMGLQSEARKLGNVKSYTDYRVMLNECRPDIAAICPRHIHEHHAMILAAIAAGVKGIYIEKPFVRTLEEADDVLKHCTAQGVRLAIAHRNRYHPALPIVKKVVESGEIGDVVEVRVRGKQDTRGGGLDLWVLGSHGLNLATIFTGRATSCEANILVLGSPATRSDIHPGDEGVGLIVGDEIHARFETTSGIPLYFDSKKGASPKKASFGTRLVGSRGTIWLNVDEEPLAILEKDQERVPITSAGIGKPEPTADIQQLVAGHHGPIRDLLAAISERREPLCGPASGREIVEMTLAVFASFAAGGTKVSIPLPNIRHPLS
jgi:predicted dehydrogenase